MLRLPTRHVLPALPPREARQLQLWLPRHGRRWCATPLLLPPREPPTFAGARSSLTTDPAAASPRNQGTRTCRVGRKATLRRSHLGANPGMEAASGVRLFTVVRHPVQRFVSAASQLKSLGLLAANASCADTLRTVELRGLFDVHLVWTDQSAASPTRALNRPIRCPPPATDGLHGRRPRRAAPVRMDLHRRGARQRHAPPGDGAGCRGRAAGAQLAARKRLPLPCRRATENRAAVRGGLQGVPPRRGAVPMGELTRQAYSCLLSCVHL
mmetsp:Transcript_33027/g.109107  ORF Transcript_33027/g.109107 Transcript_33027/m.109107 type:complete len:269 (-) Transcript_33027:69-875(-)